MNKLTIVQILRSPEGGIRKHVVDILEGLEEDKYKKVFITDFNSADRDLQYLREKFGVHFFSLKISDQPSLADLLNIVKIFSYLKKEERIILHGHGAKGGLYARICSLLLRCPSIYTPHGGSLHRVFGKVKGLVFDTVEKLLIPMTDKFVFESNYSAKEFEKYVGDCSSKSIVNYNGVSFLERGKESQYIKGSKIKLASFGLLRKLKGHDIVIEALGMIKKAKVEFSYTIYGYGEEYSNLIEKINSLDLSENVIIKDFTDNISDEMKLYDVIIHPSRFESFGYVPVEAMSLKVPVITSFEGGLKEVYIAGGSLLAINNKPEGYAVLLQKIYNGEFNLFDMSEKAFKESKDKFSVETMIKNLDGIYRSLQ